MGQKTLICSFVARGTVILAEYTEFIGIAAQCLQKLLSSNNFTYNCDGHTFNYLVENCFTLLCPYISDSQRMELVNTIVGMVGEQAWAPIKRHLGYLIFYKRNIDNMEMKFGELNAIRKDVQREVDAAARERLEEVNSAVEAWLQNVKNAEEEVTRIKDESTSAANNKGFLHFRLHHRIGRQAAAQIQDIDDLVKKGKFDRVSHSRPPPSTTGSLLVNEGYVMFESRKSYINEILNALKDETMYMIGVYGMGGIGKTALVKEAAKQAMNDGFFTEVVMVTVSQNLDVKRIQTVIAQSLSLQLDNETTLEVRAGEIEERLIIKGSRVLVVLDDLWEMLELSKVRIPDRNKGTCRVVITTRREDVCEQMECQKKVELRTLTDEESWLLFKSRAGNVVESLTMKEVTWNVAKQCAGLPLALVVLGTALKGKKLEVWKIVLNQLRKSTMALDLPGVSNKVRESIELSYNFLESDAAKLCFLHCCLFPEDYDIKEKDLLPMLVGGGLLEDVDSLHEAQDRVHVLMDQLKASGLLLEGHMESCVRMHDIVRDVAIWIGERDHGFFVRAGQGLEEWPRNSTDAKKLQNCRRLSLMDNKIVDLPSNPIQCAKLETLILRYNWKLSNIPNTFFQHMGALKVLDLSYTSISCLPESLSCLTSLRVLNLNKCCYLVDISPINGLKMLEILHLTDTFVCVVPEDTGGLLNLRQLDLGKDTNISFSSSYFFNVLRGCSRLEQLFIPEYSGCLAEMASLRFLTHLYIWGGVVDSNDSLSQDLGSSRSWTKLQEFLICFRPSPCECQLYFEMRRSRSLHLTRTKHFSPSLNALLEKTESLTLVHCQESEVISSKRDIPPHVFHNLTELEVLHGINLTSLVDEPLFQLKLMKVARCPRLTHLFWSKQAKHMQQLTELKIFDCDSLTAVVISNENQEEGASASTSSTACMVVDHHGSYSFFPRLKILVLKGLPKIAAFHQPTALPMEWPCLEDHFIEECPKLKTPLLGPQTTERINQLK